MLKLFIPIIIQNKNKTNTLLIYDITQNICKYLTENNQLSNYKKCIFEICKLLTNKNYYDNDIKLIEFDYINKWISEYQSINILKLINDQYWNHLNSKQQERFI